MTDDVLSVSIIVPLYNEATTVQSLQQQLRRLVGRAEIILVDGGSTDATVSMLDPRFTLLRARKGRGFQLNAGARHALGEVLFFLHSDSCLPPDALDELQAVMQNYDAGCFGLSFRSRNIFMLACRLYSNVRAKYQRIVFGDQGMFMKRELFYKQGLFPDIPLMEDYQFSLSLRKDGVRWGMTKHRLVTSTRRFPASNVGKLKVLFGMVHLRRLYRHGVDPAKLQALYRDIRI